MYFDKEQWQVIGAQEEHTYLSVISNRVEVIPARGKPYHVCVRVPSGMFSFIKSVLKVSVETLRKRPAEFFLEEEDGIWYFCFDYGKRRVIELWPYSGLPGWAMYGQRR